MSFSQPLCHAYCESCAGFHSLDHAPALVAAKELMEVMRREKRIDLHLKKGDAREEFRTDSLYGEARGKMFGVLSCRRPDGKLEILKGFSGQFNGRWEVEGWVPPLFDVKKFYQLTVPVEKRIKELGRELQETTTTTKERSMILRERKSLSQKLMKEIHALYSLHNFRGEQYSLFDLFGEEGRIPTGTGDCCAPKLLNLAAIHGLQPLGLAEFYWGKTNKSNSRHEGQFYPACAEKCGPILGFLLCGIEKKDLDDLTAA